VRGKIIKCINKSTLVETEYVPKLREDKKVAAVPKEHKKRGERGLYSKADLAFEEKLRKELEEKKKKDEEAAKAKPKFSDAELKVLVKETQIRANATQVRANVSNAIKVCLPRLLFLSPFFFFLPLPSFIASFP
jgi:hypothetical protein